MRHPIVLTLAIAFVILPLIGCQESESSQIQRARLVANENIKLKQQIEAKDKQIEELKQEVTRIMQEKDKAIEDAGNSNIKVLQIMSETEKRAQQLAEENQKLKEEIEKLKAQ